MDGVTGRAPRRRAASALSLETAPTGCSARGGSGLGAGTAVLLPLSPRWLAAERVRAVSTRPTARNLNVPNTPALTSESSDSSSVS